VHVNIDGAPSSKRHDMGVGLWMDFLCANSMIPHEQLYDTKLALNVRVFGVSIIHGRCYGGCESGYDYDGSIWYTLDSFERRCGM
jgi:hypothetical protein